MVAARFGGYRNRLIGRAVWSILFFVGQALSPGFDENCARPSEDQSAAKCLNSPPKLPFDLKNTETEPEALSALDLD
jgi:hypothetical protein